MTAPEIYNLMAYAQLGFYANMLNATTASASVTYSNAFFPGFSTTYSWSLS